MTESPSSPPARLVTFDLDDLYRQRAEAADQLARLVAQSDLTARKHAELDGAIHLMEQMLGLASPRDALERPTKAKASARRPSQRAMLIAAMIEADQPLGVRGLIDRVKMRFGVTIHRTSVSPLLRKLAAEGEVVHDPDGASWTLGNVDRASIEREVRGEIVRFRGPKTARREARGGMMAAREGSQTPGF